MPNQDRTVKEHTTKDKIEQAIATEIPKRFGQADSAPICQGPMFDLLSYSVNTHTAEQIHEGKFVLPLGMDGSTLIILKEIARIWRKMGTCKVEITVTTENYQHYWNKVKEKISSLISSLHFSHYKAIAHSDFLSQCLAMKLELITGTGSASETWARGLSVMLEKGGRSDACHQTTDGPPYGGRLQLAQ